MVQVDVFWAYGFGASLAAAAGRQLSSMNTSSENLPDRVTPFTSRYFIITVLFLALIWSPTGMLLLLRHPSWECMQVPNSLSDIPVFLILGFGITNITQGILGFWVSYRLFKKGRHYLAHINWLAGYLGMFFILLYGWDGLGYDRFLYDRDMLPGSPAWSEGAGIINAAGSGIYFFISSVAQTLYTDGIYLIPPWIYLFYTWNREGVNSDMSIPIEKRNPGLLKLIVTMLSAVFGAGLGTAGLAALSVHFTGKLLGADESTVMHILSYIIALPLFCTAAWFLLYRKGMPFYRLFRHFFVQEPSAESYIKSGSSQNIN